MRSVDCAGPGGWRADVGIDPYKAEPSNPGGNRHPVPDTMRAPTVSAVGDGASDAAAEAAMQAAP